jgi:hypothetical protein
LKAVEKWRVRGKGQERVMEGDEWTKIKYTHSGDTSRNLFEH